MLYLYRLYYISTKYTIGSIIYLEGCIIYVVCDETCTCSNVHTLRIVSQHLASIDWKRRVVSTARACLTLRKPSMDACGVEGMQARQRDTGPRARLEADRAVVLVLVHGNEERLPRGRWIGWD